MKKIVVIISICVLLVSGIFAARHFNTQQASRLGTAKVAKENKHNENAGGVDPKTLPEVDLTNQTEVKIDIKDYLYSKSNIKIKKGTKVTWTNQDAMQHNAMREHVGKEYAHSAPSKKEVKDNLFAGPLLSRGESYSFTFNNVESLGYHCASHPYMKAAITIVE